jgi:hypothetical protein
MSRPAYVGPGSTSALPGPAYSSPGRHIIFHGRNSRLWAGIGVFRPILAGIGWYRANFGLSGRCRWQAPRLGRRCPRLPGWANSPLRPAPQLPGWAAGGRGSPACSALGLRPGQLRVRGFSALPRLNPVPAVPPLPPSGGSHPGPGSGWVSALAPQRVRRASRDSSPPLGPHRGRPFRSRPGFGWAVLGRGRRLLLRRPQAIRPSRQIFRPLA